MIAMKRSLFPVVTLAASLVAVACSRDDGDSTSTDRPEDWPAELVITLTPSQEAQALIDDARPLGEMLSERLGIPIRAEVPTDYAGVIVALGSGQADIAGGLGPMQMVRAEARAGADLLLQSERFGDSVYVAQWFTSDPATYCDDAPEDSSYERNGERYTMRFCNGLRGAELGEAPIGESRLDLMRGAHVAFVEEGSSAGFVVPALQLRGQGIHALNDVTPIFTGGHDNAIVSVYDGDAAVGVSYRDAREELVESFADVGEKVVVFAWTGPIPNDGFAIRGDLPEDLKDAVRAALMDIANTDEGTQLLRDLYRADNLVPVDSSVYDVMRKAERELGEMVDE